ncbi:hypothetical protein MnTg02_00273 [bacterium MnTg02]|nr:hypothetical protein MnTg02_00273 [bacterium MnTg02]
MVPEGEQEEENQRRGDEGLAWAANILKIELKMRGVIYAQLVEKLEDIGVQETEVNIRNNPAQGKFSAAFLIQCLEAINCHTLHISEPS